MAFHSGKPRKGAHLIKTDKKKAEKTAAALPKKRRFPAALLVILVLIVLLAGGALGTAYFYPNIFPGVTVGSIDVGGLSRDEAAQQIATKSKPLYQGKKLTLTIYDADYDIPVENVLSGRYPVCGKRMESRPRGRAARAHDSDHQRDAKRLRYPSGRFSR